MKPRLAQSEIHFIMQISIADDRVNKFEVGSKEKIKTGFSGEKNNKCISTSILIQHST